MRKYLSDQGDFCLTCPTNFREHWLRITAWHHCVSLLMPYSYPHDGIFNPHITTIKDSYILAYQTRFSAIFTSADKSYLTYPYPTRGIDKKQRTTRVAIGGHVTLSLRRWELTSLWRHIPGLSFARFFLAPVPMAKKMFFFPIPDEKFPIWLKAIWSQKIQVVLAANGLKM